MISQIKNNHEAEWLEIVWSADPVTAVSLSWTDLLVTGTLMIIIS